MFFQNMKDFSLGKMWYLTITNTFQWWLYPKGRLFLQNNPHFKSGVTKPVY